MYGYIEWSLIIDKDRNIDTKQKHGCLITVPFYFIKQFSSPAFVSKVVFIFTTTWDTLNAVS